MAEGWNDSELLNAIRSCSQCSNLPLGPRPILQWDPAAPILIAGQAPGRLTHAKGIPFDDPSGDRLRDWLGVDRDTFYDPAKFAIIPMAFCYPGTGKSGDLPPPAICAASWRNPLLDRLKNLKLIVVLGQYAAAWHFPKHKGTLTELASSWKSTLPHKIVIPHPSPRNQRWLGNNPWFTSDVIPQLRARVKDVIS